MAKGNPPKRLLLLGAFLLCIAFGFGLALLLKERLGEGTAEADPCFGQGQLVGKWQVDVPQAEIDSTKDSAPQLADRKPGLTEFRTCKTERGDSVILDQYGHVFSYTPATLAELESYYKNHPDLDPRNQQANAEAESLQRSFVTPDAPKAAVDGCDPSWPKTTLQGVGVVFCHPVDWVVTEDDSNSAGMRSGNGHVEVGVLSASTKGSAGTRCDTPETVEAPQGPVRVCAFGPGIGQGHGFVLPDGREGGVNIYPEATEEERATAFRVAFNVEVLP